MTECECEIPTMEEALFRGCDECLEELYSVSIEREGGKIYYLNEYNEVIHTRSSDEEAER